MHELEEDISMSKNTHKIIKEYLTKVKLKEIEFSEIDLLTLTKEHLLKDGVQKFNYQIEMIDDKLHFNIYIKTSHFQYTVKYKNT